MKKEKLNELWSCDISISGELVLKCSVLKKILFGENFQFDIVWSRFSRAIDRAINTMHPGNALRVIVTKQQSSINDNDNRKTNDNRKKARTLYTQLSKREINDNY